MNDELLAQLERKVLEWPRVWKKRDESGPGGIGVTGYRLGRGQVPNLGDQGALRLR